jgi:uncharacterized small protein (DUF1192 family)
VRFGPKDQQKMPLTPKRLWSLISRPRAIIFIKMFDDERAKPKTKEFPRNIIDYSVSELDEYIVDLKAEIERCEGDKAKKKASADAASSVFKF